MLEEKISNLKLRLRLIYKHLQKWRKDSNNIKHYDLLRVVLTSQAILQC